MICPRCKEGNIDKVYFKKEKKHGVLCDSCRSVWYEGEVINEDSAHDIQALTMDDEMEYTFNDIGERDLDKESVDYPKHK